MSNTDQRPKLTVEDLLHLKRSERPPQEFWNRFDAELRQKQLAALLKRRPWWHGIAQAFSRRAYLPVGATAVLALTLVSVKYYSPTRVAVINSPEVPATTSVAPAVVALDRAPAPAEAVAADLPDDRTPIAATRLSERLPDRASELVPWIATPTAVEETPSAKVIAANIARLEQTEPDLANAARNGRFPVSDRQSENVSVVKPAVELAAVSAVASKRNRLLAQFNERHFTPEPQAPEIVRERLVRRIGDGDISDRFSRIGVKGDQVSLKF